MYKSSCFRAKTCVVTYFILSLAFSRILIAQDDTDKGLDPESLFTSCLLEQIKQKPEASALDMRTTCAEQINGIAANKGTRSSPYEERSHEERTTLLKNFVITPHRPNYALPISYNVNSNEHFEQVEGADEADLDHTEMQFQVSMKYPVWDTILRSNWSLFSAYTARSFWQAYNSKQSSPFRDTNHEPEMWLEHPLDQNIGKFHAQWIRFGFVHQSNGRSSVFSRSWNRIYAETAFDIGKTFIGTKIWYRVPEDEKENPNDAKGDDNPDITQFLGHFEVLAAFKYKGNSFSGLLRNNLKSDNKGAIEISWSFPTGGKVRGYVKYFNGYGETLIDYNRRTSRFSLGFLVADWI